MEDYLKGIDASLWRLIDKGPYRADRLQAVGIVGEVEDVIVQEKKRRIMIRDVFVSYMELCHRSCITTFVAT